jgi:predicted nucleic-acid-binding protein
MIGLDTNILARYYIEDVTDEEAQKQRKIAQKLIEGDSSLMVCKTVLLEFEWIMRGYYHFDRDKIVRVYEHLLSLKSLIMEDRTAVEQALGHYQAGLDFADALHHASYHNCNSMATFDDRKFARRAHRMELKPAVDIPQ